MLRSRCIRALGGVVLLGWPLVAGAMRLPGRDIAHRVVKYTKALQHIEHSTKLPKGKLSDVRFDAMDAKRHLDDLKSILSQDEFKENSQLVHVRNLLMLPQEKIDHRGNQIVVHLGAAMMSTHQFWIKPGSVGTWSYELKNYDGTIAAFELDDNGLSEITLGKNTVLRTSKKDHR